MSESEISELIDKAIAGRLGAEEELRWNTLLAERPELEEYLAVGNALQALPAPPPVSSNFTSRVLQQINLEEKAVQRRVWRGWWSWAGLARIAATAAVVGIGLGTFKTRNQTQMAEAALKFEQSVNAVAHKNPEAVAALFKDFEVIRNLPEVDSVLLSALSSEP